MDNSSDPNIEAWAIAECLRDNTAIDVLAAELHAADFSDEIHQRAFHLLLMFRSEGGGATPAILQSHMRAELDEIDGGQDYFRIITASAPVSGAITDYVAILKDLSQRRTLAGIGQTLAEGACRAASETPTQALVGEATEALFKILSTDSRPEESPSEVAGAVLDEADAALRGERPPSIPTGLKKLDKVIGGIMPEETIWVPAQSGMGKSALLGSVSLGAARAGHPVLFFTKEMSTRQIVQRMLCDIDFDLRTKDEPPIEYWKFRAGCLSKFEVRRLRQAREVLTGLPLRFRNDAGLTMNGLISRSRAFAGRYSGQLGLVVVDFLQIVRDDNPGKTDTRENVVSRLAYAHKELAKMLGWGVMAAVQMLNKSSAHYDPAKDLPTAEAIRESGAIEQSGDIIISPYRKAFFHKRKEPAVPHEREEWQKWHGTMEEIKHDFWLRGMKLRGGDPSVLNLELWAHMGSSAIRDERPGRYHMPSDAPVEEELRF